jgi:hypothetical protein
MTSGEIVRSHFLDEGDRYSNLDPEDIADLPYQTAQMISVDESYVGRARIEEIKKQIRETGVYDGPIMGRPEELAIRPEGYGALSIEETSPGWHRVLPLFVPWPETHPVGVMIWRDEQAKHARENPRLMFTKEETAAVVGAAQQVRSDMTDMYEQDILYAQGKYEALHEDFGEDDEDEEPEHRQAPEPYHFVEGITPAREYVAVVERPGAPLDENFTIYHAPIAALATSDPIRTQVVSYFDVKRLRDGGTTMLPTEFGEINKPAPPDGKRMPSPATIDGREIIPIEHLIDPQLFEANQGGHTS